MGQVYLVRQRENAYEGDYAVVGVCPTPEAAQSLADWVGWADVETWDVVEYNHLREGDRAWDVFLGPRGGISSKFPPREVDRAKSLHETPVESLPDRRERKELVYVVFVHAPNRRKAAERARHLFKEQIGK